MSLRCEALVSDQHEASEALRHVIVRPLWETDGSTSERGLEVFVNLASRHEAALMVIHPLFHVDRDSNGVMQLPTEGHLSDHLLDLGRLINESQRIGMPVMIFIETPKTLLEDGKPNIFPTKRKAELDIYRRMYMDILTQACDLDTTRMTEPVFLVMTAPKGPVPLVDESTFELEDWKLRAISVFSQLKDHDKETIYDMTLLDYFLSNIDVHKKSRIRMYLAGSNLTGALSSQIERAFADVFLQERGAGIIEFYHTAQNNPDQLAYPDPSGHLQRPNNKPKHIFATVSPEGCVAFFYRRALEGGFPTYLTNRTYPTLVPRRDEVGFVDNPLGGYGMFISTSPRVRKYCS